MAIEILQLGLPKLDFILILLKLYIKDFHLFSFFAKQNDSHLVGAWVPSGTTEAELAGAFYTEQGVDMKRVTLESKARNTRENARQVAALLGERCKQPWLLVTSAWHMPRSMAEFEATGCNVTAYPVDFHTAEKSSWAEYSMVGSLAAWQKALHELLGMFVYRITR